MGNKIKNKEKDKSKKHQTLANPLVDKLNLTLASYQVHYQNLRGIHWNIKGKNFFELHVKFEELYTDAQVKIDEIAELILTLGYQPLHTFSDYIENSKVKPAKNISKDSEAVEMIVADLQTLVQIEKEVFELAEGNISVEDLMTQFIAFQEKTLWMYKAWLG
ncbi:MAG: DNA starvation/stationary phase protection protein [Chitinophagales bacterium]